MAEQRQSPCINSPSTEISRMVQAGYAQKYVHTKHSPHSTRAMLLLQTAPDQVCTTEGVERVAGFVLYVKYLTVIQEKKSSALQKERSWSATENTQLRCPSEVNESIPYLLGLESLINALSSKSNQRNISVEWPHCFSMLLQDVQCEGNLRSLDTFCTRRWRIDSNKPTKTSKVKNLTKTQAHISLCCQYTALSWLWAPATNIRTVQCTLFYPLPLFEPHREGIKLFTDTHTVLLHYAIIVYPSDLKNVLYWILLKPMQGYIRIFWRPKVHIWDARCNERCCQLCWHTPPSLHPPSQSISTPPNSLSVNQNSSCKPDSKYKHLPRCPLRQRLSPRLECRASAPADDGRSSAPEQLCQCGNHTQPQLHLQSCGALGFKLSRRRRAVQVSRGPDTGVRHRWPWTGGRTGSRTDEPPLT